MRGLRYVVPALFLAFAVMGEADAKIRKSKVKVVAAEPDTCTVDTFSYAMGMANTQGLMNYIATRLNVDTAYMANFMEGFTADLSDDEMKRLRAYVAGQEICRQLEQQIIPALNKQITGDETRKLLQEELFMEGFTKTLAGEPTKMTMSHAQTVADKQMKYYHEVQMERQYGDNKKAGEAFLKDNAKKDSVETLKSGVQYKVLVKGEGAVPKATSKVKVNYEGKLIDGTVFDSSYKRKQPATFGCNQVIKGWTEALTHMPVGSKWEIYIPQELGYGDREAGKIPPYSALIFTVELLEIVE